MKTKLLYITILPLLITSCNGGGNSNKDSYTTKEIHAYYSDSKNNTAVNLRYYNKSVIPYISLKDYQQLLYRGRTYPEGRDRMDMSKQGDVYTFTVAGDFSATFDVKNNKMESSNLWSFKNTNLNGVGDINSASYDGLPFTKPTGVTYSGTPVTTVIDFSKYDLKIYGDDKGVYVPLGFALDLFSNENILQGAYNSKDIYIFNFTENESLNDFGGRYYNAMYSNSIKQEYANYVYNELCLDYDFFLGRPGRSSLEFYYYLANGLDAALNSRTLGRTISSYMKSTDLGKFIAGATLLGLLRQDGGHSGYSPLNTYYFDQASGQYARPTWLTDSLYMNAYSYVSAELSKHFEELDNYDRSIGYHSDIYKARNEKLGKPSRSLSGTETYTKDGDVAYIHIDGFMGEIGLQNEWKKYYAGERDTIPFGDGVGGAVGAISYGVREASKDSEIKHLILDLAANTGGSTDEMLFMIGLLTGSSSFYTHNTMNKTFNTATYSFDFNFDKVFDEKDKEIYSLLEGKDITVLATRNGFSCGGISPIYLHDEGLFTIGEECGGGSCSIYMQYDGYGNNNRASTPSHTVSKNLVSIDVARKTVCDHKLNFPSDQTGYDYSSLYDTATLRALIEAHYSK